MEPTQKADAINDAISNLVGRNRVETITNNLCMCCEKPANDFRDDLSRKEYSISGMCQDCQDSFFGCGDGEEYPHEIDGYYDDDDYDYDDGQPDEYTEWQDYMGGDDWDFGQYDGEW